MSSKRIFTGEHFKQIRDKGIDPEQIEEQLSRFEQGFPDLNLVRPATVGDGIVQIPENEHDYLFERYRQAQHEGRLMKFVPASGAASRMFKTLQSMLHSENKLSDEYFEAHPDDEEVVFTRAFLENLEVFAFYEDLVDVLSMHGKHPNQLKKEGDYHTLLTYVLEEKGLGLASLPKALIPFHRYADHRRTPMEEHLVEAAEYTKSENGNVRIHFTISPEHEAAFHQRLEAVRARYENENTNFLVETSFQKPETDTIAADLQNRPFFDENNALVFRAGGHGALLDNLEDLKGDVVLIKNIDNVLPDHLKSITYRYKKLLGGYLFMLQDRVFSYLKELSRGSIQPEFLKEVREFIRNEFYIDIPPKIAGNDGDSGSVVAQWLHDRLNRPMRVCGMVKNEGDPGGGPFIVRDENGSISPQIVESAQVNMDDPGQKRIFESSTHFNPVDLVCSLRDYQGKPFRLKSFRNPETGFISRKSYQGRELKALELPGLWNGSMAYWNTVFVEVPSETFQPVKTVNDLLKKEHRNE